MRSGRIWLRLHDGGRRYCCAAAVPAGLRIAGRGWKMLNFLDLAQAGCL